MYIKNTKNITNFLSKRSDIREGRERGRPPFRRGRSRSPYRNDRRRSRSHHSYRERSSRYPSRSPVRNVRRGDYRLIVENIPEDMTWMDLKVFFFKSFCSQKKLCCDFMFAVLWRLSNHQNGSSSPLACYFVRI